MRVVVVGSSNTDLVVHAPQLPKPGQTVLGGTFQQFAGGKGANQAVAAARAGAEVIFVGARGDDAFGAQARAALRAEGIDTRYFIEKPGSASGIALIMVGGKDRENLIAVAKSANDALSPVDVRSAEPAIRRAGAVIAQLEVPLDAVIEAAALAVKHRIPFILNPAPARKLPAKLLRSVHTIVPNEEEAIRLTRGSKASIGHRYTKLAARHPMAASAAASLLQLGCRNVVVTLGSSGALVAAGGDVSLIRSPRVKAVDTVGAGDCFTAWLAVGIAEGLDHRSGAERAAHAAAIAVTRAGAQAAMPLRAEVVL